MSRWCFSLFLLVGSTFGNPLGLSVIIANAGAPSMPGIDGNAVVQFDLPPIAPAIATSDDASVVTVELPLSSMIVSPDTPPIDQWLVRCQPRDRSLSIVDYAPRTETGSDLATSIQIKNTTEKGSALGIGLEGGYGHLARANAAADHSKKRMNSVQFEKIAPVHAVTASGTINRGRGVYFKLRWTAQQILEGEKTFQLTLKVPHDWRGGLMDVSVIAQGERKSFGWEREIKTLGSASFVVAVFRHQDEQAEAIARSLAESEHALRVLAAQHRTVKVDSHSIPSMLRHVATKFDFDSDPRPDDDWLPRLLTHRADPYLDKQISRLPVSLRVAILDYCDQRDAFLELGQPATAVNIDKLSRRK